MTSYKAYIIVSLKKPVGGHEVTETTVLAAQVTQIH